MYSATKPESTSEQSPNFSAPENVGKLLKQVYGSADHFIVERDGYPVAVLMSYQEYEQLSHLQTEIPLPKKLPPVMSLEEAFGSITPLSQPEDFTALRDAAIEDHMESFAEKLKN